MGEILIECSKCGIEMKYSLYKIHICTGHKIGELDQLFELIDEMLGIDEVES